MVSICAVVSGFFAFAGGIVIERALFKPLGNAPVLTHVAGFIALFSIINSVAGLTWDFTINTDFPQVEADEQQVNLTRFSLFFPEKRDFFLENQGIFTFGNNSSGTSNNSSSDVPLLFYSRRIGLDEGHIVPIDVGGRLIGRVGGVHIRITSRGRVPTGVDVPPEAAWEVLLSSAGGRRGEGPQDGRFALAGDEALVLIRRPPGAAG